MDFDVLAAPAVPPPVRVDSLERAEFDSPASQEPSVTRPTAAAVVVPHQVHLSFHEDLRVLMTRVIDVPTGDVVREYPTRQVLDMVADVMKRMRAREEG